MGILRRILSVDYRKALAAEAQGDFLTAAKYYALCGERLKVTDMQLAQAQTESRSEERIRWLRSALLFMEGGDERRPMVVRLLGRALRDRAASQSPTPDERRALLEEAAAMLESGESWEGAAGCYLELGDRNRAADAYARAGLVERVEEVLAQQERAQSRERVEDDSFRNYELLLQGGQRDEALAALKACFDAADGKGEYRRLIEKLEGQRIGSGRVELAVSARKLVLVGRYPVLIGRDVDCDLQIRGAAISRRHTRLDLQDNILVLTDLDSRAGTLLNGLRIGAALPLPPAGNIGLGDECLIDFAIDQSQVLRLEVRRGLDHGAVVLISVAPVRIRQWLPEAPDVELSFDQGRPMVRGNGQLRLNGALVTGSVQLIRHDELQVDQSCLCVLG